MGSITLKRHRVLLLWATALAGLSSYPHLSGSTRGVEFASQESCTDTATSGETNLDPLKLLIGNCRIEDGGYAVRTSEVGVPPTRVTVHGRATATGHCTKRIMSGFPAVCTVTYDRDRGMNAISVRYNRPGNPQPNAPESLGAILPKPGNAIYQTLDSEDTTRTYGPRYIDLVEFGGYMAEEQGIVFTTLCNIGPGATDVKQLRFFAVDCAPNWQLTDEQNILHLPLGQTIKISAPTALQSAAASAATAWESKLADRGIVIDFEIGICTPAVDRGRCIIIKEENPPANSQACAGFFANDDHLTGLIAYSPEIYIPSRGYSPDKLKNLISHELGHLLGLTDSDCDPSKTIMWEPETYACDEIPSGAALEAQTNDALPIANTPYGTGARASCPAQ